jgi:hypothetical protein
MWDEKVGRSVPDHPVPVSSKGPSVKPRSPEISAEKVGDATRQQRRGRENSLLIPDHRSETKYFISDSPNATVRISIRRPPEAGYATARTISNDLHRPANFCDNGFV